MKQSLHEYFDFIGKRENFHDAILIQLTLGLCFITIGLLIAWIAFLIINKKGRHAKYSGSLDDLVDSVNGFRRRKVH